MGFLAYSGKMRNGWTVKDSKIVGKPCERTLRIEDAAVCDLWFGPLEVIQGPNLLVNKELKTPSRLGDCSVFEGFEG